MTPNSPAMSEWGSFALVTYIPEPLSSFLHSLRRALPGEENPQAHITLLPPRPLAAPIDPVSREAQNTLARFSPFVIKLSDIKLFKESSVFYLDISTGNQTLHEIHDVLAAGLLAHQEDFPFRPHVTISGSIPPSDTAKVRTKAKAAWRKFSGDASFEINEATALWQKHYTSPDNWTRLWTQRLGDTGTSARAGSRA